MLRFGHPGYLGAWIACALSWLWLGCGSDGGSGPITIENRPPILRRFEVVEDRVHAAEDVTAVASAIDPDQDPLDYFWTVNRGSFPFGRGGVSVKWRTPDTRGVDTLFVRISDRQDTTFAALAVALVRVFPPDSIWTANSTTLADVSWSESPDEGIQNWVGYDVYAAEHSLAGLSEEEVEPYRVTAEPILTRTKRVLSLVAGQRYYFHVRSVRKYSGVTERSRFAGETVMSPRPSGDVSGLIEIRGGSGTAFDISAGAIRPLDPMDASGIGLRDLYVDADPAAPDERVVLRGVSELASFDPAWADRVVELKRLGDDFAVSSTDPEVGWGTSVSAGIGDVIAIRTPEGNYGKVRITIIQSFRPNRNVWLTWAYQTIPDFVSF